MTHGDAGAFRIAVEWLGFIAVVILFVVLLAVGAVVYFAVVLPGDLYAWVRTGKRPVSRIT